MKFLGKKQSEAGSAMLVAVMVTGLIATLLAVYLTMVGNQNTATMRSQAWNAAIPIIEAGIEDAMAHLNTHGTTNLACDGWQLINGQYIIQRNIGHGFYIVGISNAATALITSQGYVELPRLASATPAYLFAVASTPISSTHLGRGIRVRARRDALFVKGLVAKGQINMNGNNIATDSYDSSNPTYSTNSRYDATKAKESGDVATNSGLVNSLNVGNADIIGKVSTGPGGTVQIGNNGAVGSKAWHDAGYSGIQPGYASDDMNVTFPNVEPPFTGGWVAPIGGTVGTTNYTYLLGTGNYQLASLNMSGQSTLMVTGDAILYVTGNVDISGNASVVVAPGGSLKLYVAGATANLGGNGIFNKNLTPDKFIYYGLPSNTTLSLGGNTEFTGIVYAPDAALALTGGGSTFTDFSGASISKTVVMNGHYRFHYDEALKDFQASHGFIVTSWDEIPPSELGTLAQHIGANPR